MGIGAILVIIGIILLVLGHIWFGILVLIFGPLWLGILLIILGLLFGGFRRGRWY